MAVGIVRRADDHVAVAADQDGVTARPGSEWRHSEIDHAAVLRPSKRASEDARGLPIADDHRAITVRADRMGLENVARGDPKVEHARTIRPAARLRTGFDRASANDHVAVAAEGRCRDVPDPLEAGKLAMLACPLAWTRARDARV